MDDKLVKKQIRRDFSRLGWALLIYYGIMNAAVLLVDLVDVVIRMIQSMAQGQLPQQDFTSAIMGNAWGFFLAAGVGMIFLVLWKGKEFVFRDIWEKGKPMSVGSFLTVLCILMCGQAVFQIVASVLEMLLNLLGLSAMEAIEAASLSMTDSFSMFLYAGVLAPVAEEILFRGLVLRAVQPYGRKLAILVSAVLFGLFHGNIVQSPFAFVMGLVLGYVALEYNIVWAMALHMFNNLLIADVLTRLLSQLDTVLANLLSTGVIWGFALAGMVLMLLRRQQIGAYLRGEKINPFYVKCCFSGAGIIVLAVVMVLNMLFTITVL